MAAPTRRYRNFDLEILAVEGQQGIYRARVIDSPVGQASTDFVLHPTLGLYHDKLDLIGSAIRAYQFVTSEGNQPIQPLNPQTFGQNLFKSVFVDQVNAHLRRSLDAVRREGINLRIRLRLNAVPELAKLPWEYLFDADDSYFLVLSKQLSLVRYLDKATEEKPLQIELPLRILVMTADPRDVIPRLKVEQEWEQLQMALGSLQRKGIVMVDRLQDATAVELMKHLDKGQYHIFHFIGHGWFDVSDEDGGLVLANKGRGERVSKKRLGTALRDLPSLRLVFLNACEGARATDKQPFGGVAQHLIQQGLPAVIAMQFPVVDETAITLAEEFYSSLADGHAVDTALTEARRIIHVKGSIMEWGIPVLFSRSADNRLFDLPQHSATFDNTHLSNSLLEIMESGNSWNFGIYGFYEDPFSYTNAEQLIKRSDILQDTFIPYSISYEQIVDFTRSSVLVASPGSGKTMGRIWIEEKLKESRQASLSESSTDVPFPQMPFIVCYDDFSQVVEAIPHIRLSHHREPLLHALAKSIELFEEEYDQQISIESAKHLDNAKAFLRSCIQNPKRGSISMPKIFRDLFQYLQPLHFDAIVILVDNLDSHAQTYESPPNVEYLIRPLLNTAELFDPPIYWKFFAPSSMRNEVISSLAYRRLQLRFVPLEWDKVSLSLVLKQRLKWASEDTISDMSQLCDTSLLDEVKDLNVELAQLALRNQIFGPPRTLLKLSQALLQELSANGSPITLQHWLRFKTRLRG